MKKRLTVVFVLLSMLLSLLSVPAQAAGEPRVRITNWSTDQVILGQWVEYEINGTRFRSDRMGAAFNLHAFNMMSAEDKRRCVNTCSFRNRQEQFGVDGSAEMCNWLDDYLGWTDARKVLKKRIADREFAPINAYFSNDTASPFDAEFSVLLRENEGLPEVQALLALREKLDATYRTGKAVANTLSDATMDKVNAGVKILGKETISLITDRVLVPAITPAGMAGMGAEIAEEVIAFVDKATGITDALYSGAGLGADNDPTTLMQGLNAVISENTAAANRLMEESQLLQADLEEAVYAAQAAIEDNVDTQADSENPTVFLMAAKSQPDAKTAEWFGTRCGEIQKKLDALATEYVDTFERWANLLEKGMPDVVAKQAKNTYESGGLLYTEVPKSLTIIQWRDYNDACQAGNTERLELLKNRNPVIYNSFAQIRNGNTTLENCIRSWGPEVEKCADKERELRNKLTYLGDQLTYYQQMLKNTHDANYSSLLLPYAKAEYPELTEFYEHTAILSPPVEGARKLSGTPASDCNWRTQFKYEAISAILHFMDEDFNLRSSYAADFELVKEEILSYYRSAKYYRAYDEAELRQIELDYFNQWMNIFNGGMDGSTGYNYCPKGSRYASDYLTWLCRDHNYYNYINGNIYTGSLLYRKMATLYNTYFGSLGGQDGLIWKAAGLLKTPVKLLPSGSAQLSIAVNGKVPVGISLTPAAPLNDILWASNDGSIVSVDGSGTTAILTGHCAGTTTVTATLLDAAASYDYETQTCSYSPEPVTFTVTVGDASEDEYSFSDVPKDAYYREPVLWAVNQGITQGTGRNKFSPDLNCTRGQLVTFLWRAKGLPEPAAAVSTFTDVAEPTAYYYKAVLWAVENGITNGTGNNRFSPSAIVTRAQAVTFLWRAAGAPASASECSFSDVKASSYYADAVRWAVASGVTQGTGGNLFRPDSPCTRAQIVTFLYRQQK